VKSTPKVWPVIGTSSDQGGRKDTWAHAASTSEPGRWEYKRYRARQVVSTLMEAKVQVLAGHVHALTEECGQEHEDKAR
jgi:hypothetical protein